MPGRRIVIDGLWRCLCPSYDAIGCHQLSRPLRRVAAQTRNRSSRTGGTSTSKCLHVRTIHSEGAKTKEIPETNDTRQRDALLKRMQFADGGGIGFRNRSWEEMPVSELHDVLWGLKNKEGEYQKVVELVEYMLQRTEAKPSLVHYNALVSANADAIHGSAIAVAELLGALKTEGIAADSELYHSAMQALAVHPDYVLRSEVLREMNERWFTLNSDGWHNLVVGLLRDRQYEMALDKLEQKQFEREPIQPWLYDIFIYLFCEAEELDEALKILKYRVESGDMDISPNIWYAVLDVCSRNFHYQGTKYVWVKRVERSLINPPDGMCLNALNTAARHCDPRLATAVIRILAGRKYKLDIHHYEALLDAYIGSGDLKTALRLLIIMKKAKLEPEEGTTRPLHGYLTTSPELPAIAWQELKSLREDGHDVPVSAVNCILEAFVSTGQQQEALDRYKVFDTVCSSAPETATINALLKNLVVLEDSKKIGMFLASEMASLGIRPNQLTFDRLILVCLDEDDYEDAFRYLDEMKVVFPGSELRPGTMQALISVCAINRDDRGWAILAELEEKGQATMKMRTLMDQAWAAERGSSSQIHLSGHITSAM